MNNVNVNLGVVADFRKPISMVGASLGTCFFKAEARAGMPDFEQKVLQVKQGGNIQFCLNRTPNRYRVTDHEVLSVQVGSDATGATKVYINKDSDGEVSIPVVPGMDKIGVVTEDALGKALRGDSNIIFSDVRKLVAQVNTLNTDEKTRLEAIRAEIDKCIAQIDSAISANNKKASDYEAQLLKSTPSNIPGAASATVIVTGED